MAETLRPDPLTPEHRLLMPPHPGEVYQSSALCSCGDWQFDADSFSDLTNEYRLVLTEHTAHARAALRAATPDPAKPRPFCPQCGYESCKHGYRPDRPAEPGLPWLRARVRDVVHRQYDANDIDRWAILKAIDAALSDTARTEGLDAAWAEAEAALPEGWRLHLTRRPEGSLIATASNRDGASATSYAQATPAAALRALAARLTHPKNPA